MKFLILSVTAGEGHNSTAKAIRKELESRGCECTILDTFDYISPELAKLISEGYLLVTEKARTAYKLGYRMAEKRRSGHEHTPMKIINLAMSDDLSAYIHGGDFDTIIYTHPFAGTILDVMKERRIIHHRTVGILTDFTFHPYWEDGTRSDYAVVPDSLLLPQAKRKGFAESQILPFGIPISSRFSEKISKTEARTKLGLDPELPLILIMGGSMGYGNIGETVSKIDSISSGSDFGMLVVCGNNAEAKKQAEEIAAGSKHSIRVYGFVDNIPDMMSAADCLVSKPGGLTTSECLAKGLPMIIVNPIPGQEERNAEFLLNTGCAMMASKTFPLEDCIYTLLSSPERMESMRIAASAVGKPDSCKKLAEFLISLSPNASPAEHTSSDFTENPLYVSEEGYIVRYAYET